jgi:CRP/FNR family cyclic AMP-dependent transcriptional regulator
MHSQPCSACSAQRSFCSLSDQLHAVFETLKTSVNYAKGEFAFHEADACHNVFVVCAGSMKLVTSSSEGRVLLLRFAGPGTLLGLTEAMLERRPYQCSAIAAEPSALAVIPAETFVRFVTSYPEACLRLTVALSEQYKMAQRETKFLALGGSSISRLAHLLLEEASVHGEFEPDGIHIPLHVTHSELAQSIGSTRETVTRILGELNQSGVIERTADAIVIHGTEELTRLAAY